MSLTVADCLAEKTVARLLFAFLEGRRFIDRYSAVNEQERIS